jgi:hypothetical protein
MASTTPIPAPPGTPTPPPEEESCESGLGLDGIPYATPREILYDPNCLSPADPNGHFGSMSANMISPAGADSVYSPMSMDSGKSDASNPFNFQTTTLAKSPITKSVNYLPFRNQAHLRLLRAGLTYPRTSARDAGTSTSTAASLIRSFSSLLSERRSPCRTRCQSLHLLSAELACRRIRRLDSGGAYVTSRSPDMRFGVRRGRLPWRHYHIS